MVTKEKNFAYIDGANLDKGVASLGWRLDYQRFRIWLRDKYQVEQAYIFIGLIPEFTNLYFHLQEAGFILIFKEIIRDSDGNVKGNCDADLVLKVVVDYYEKKCDKAIIVSSDGDYSGLVKFLKEKKSLISVISPSNKCSYLLRKLNVSLVYLDTKRSNLELSSQ